MYSFPDLEPVCCSMSNSNCCFLTCIQISQEAGQVDCWFTAQVYNSGIARQKRSTEQSRRKGYTAARPLWVCHPHPQKSPHLQIQVVLEGGLLWITKGSFLLWTLLLSSLKKFQWFEELGAKNGRLNTYLLQITLSEVVIPLVMKSDLKS